MSSAATDKAWETLGRVDPYWAVISNDAYHGRRLTNRPRRIPEIQGQITSITSGAPAGVCLEMTSRPAAAWILDAASKE